MTVKVNLDSAERAVIHAADLPWKATAHHGLEEKLFESGGINGARHSKLLRCKPGLSVPRHRHDAGEEFLVLEGTLTDDLGHYPVGTYVRNPPGSSHAPFTRDGCILFIKMVTFSPGDHARVVIDTGEAEWQAGGRDGTSIIPLYRFGAEAAALCRWEPSTGLPSHRHAGGEEIFVLSGTLHDERGSYPRGTWVRDPFGSFHRPYSKQGCVFFLKTGHVGQSHVASELLVS